MNPEEPEMLNLDDLPPGIIAQAMRVTDLLARADQAVAEAAQVARVHAALFHKYVEMGFERSEALVLVIASIEAAAGRET